MSLGLNIYQLVQSNLPAGFTVTNDYVDTRLKYWRALLYESADIDEADKFNDNAWTALPKADEWAILMSYCITYDIYLLILTGNFISTAGSNEESSEGGGQVKKIITGPTEVEFHNNTESLASILKLITGPAGLFDQFMSLACAFATRLGVKLPFCTLNGFAGRIIIGKRPLRGKRYFNWVTKKHIK